jgi:hypothetical protein
MNNKIVNNGITMRIFSKTIIFIFFCCTIQSVFTSASAAALHTFTSKTYHYSIQYPADWKLYDKGKGVVVFKSTTNNQQHEAMVNIQTIFTKKGGGKYASIKDLMDDFWSQVPMHTQAAHFLERNPVILIEPDGTKLSGEQTLFTFREDGKSYKQWQTMIMSRDGILFQAFAYRSTAADFAASYPLAKAMFASWIIY